MKKLFIFTVFCIGLGLLSCNDIPNDTPENNPKTESVNIDLSDPRIENAQIVCCGVQSPQQNLPWLADIIKKANTYEDQYLGTIWLENYKGKDIIVTDMGLGSGGLMYHIFDCSGNYLFLQMGSEEIYSIPMKFNVVLYSNVNKLSDE